MSRIVSLAIERAGLGPVAEARRSGASLEPYRALLETADLLALGALADELRRNDVGDDVRVQVGETTDDGVITLPLAERPHGDDAGLHLLRDTATARILAPRGATVRVSWADVGIEIALVALGFGANELAGRISNRRGLPLVDGAKVGWGKRSTYVPAELAKKQELSGHIRQAGRRALFVMPDGREETYGPLGAVTLDDDTTEVHA